MALQRFKTWPLTCCLCFMPIFFIPVSAFIACHCCLPRALQGSVLPRLVQCFADAACVSCQYEEQVSAQLYSKDLSRHVLAYVPPAFLVLKELH